MKLDMQPDSDLIRVRAIGEFSLEAAKTTFLEMIEALALHRAKRVLFDGRTITGSPEIMERFYYGEFAAATVARYQERGVSLATLFAYVLSEPVLDPKKFGETVAVNRFMHVKTFNNLEKALEWLATASTNKPDAGSDK